MRIETGIVVGHAPLGEAYRLLTMKLPGIAAEARPGQFIHLRIAQLHDALLRRPFSIYRVDGSHLSILYKTVGRGTAAMQGLKHDDAVSVIGPLGNGFPLDLDAGTTPVLVAGGYGVAPLYFLARSMRSRGMLFVGGARGADILLVDEFRRLDWEVEVATEDGSLGTKGLVTAPLDSWLRNHPSARPVFFACGPNGMLRAIGDVAIRTGQTGWLSLDRHMGCGVGACLACVQTVRLNGQETRVRVCKEGPVFECRDVVWGD